MEVVAQLASTKMQLETALWRYSKSSYVTKAEGDCDAVEKTGQTVPERGESDEESTSTAVPVKVLQ